MSRLKDDLGPWFVRVAENKVSVGIFACTELELADLIDEVCEPDACEYKRLPSGGFIFGGEVVLHKWDPETDAEHMHDCDLTEEWCAAYEDAGEWSELMHRTSAERSSGPVTRGAGVLPVLSVAPGALSEPPQLSEVACPCLAVWDKMRERF